MSGKRKTTSVVSFSCDLETLNYLDDYSTMNGINVSMTIRYFIRMGRTYLKILDEQQKMLESSVSGANDGTH